MIVLGGLGGRDSALQAFGLGLLVTASLSLTIAAPEQGPTDHVDVVEAVASFRRSIGADAVFAREVTSTATITTQVDLQSER